MEFTGERYVPELDEPEISFEHWHRYLWSAPLCAGKRVLDVACGEGYGAAFLAETASHVTGVDADAATIAHACAAYAQDNLDFMCGPAQNLPIADAEAFDVVVSFETIEHLSEADQRRFLAEVRRVLTPDGIALFSTPNRTIYTDRPHYHNPFHRKEFYPKEFRAMLGQSFAHVRLLGQRVFGASYLWLLDGESESLREYQLDYRGGAFIPANRDRKEAVYVIALCSDHAIAESDCSILLDTANRMMSEQAQPVAGLRMMEDQAALQETTIAQEAHIAMLGERLDFLTTREAEARRLLISVHEQLALRDADHRTLLGNYEQQRRDLTKVQEQRASLSLELRTLERERAETARRIAALERDWQEKNAYIETLEKIVRTSPLILRISRRLQQLIHA